MLKNQKGMTLVEIMIVLAIIGGLLAILAPRFTGQLDKSRVSNTKIQMGQIMSALDTYNSDCGSYPQSLQSLVEAPADCANWGPKYLKNPPKDAWNSDFEYTLEGGTYVLKSYGKDKTPGGSGLNKDISSDEL